MTRRPQRPPLPRSLHPPATPTVAWPSPCVGMLPRPRGRTRRSPCHARSRSSGHPRRLRARQEARARLRRSRLQRRRLHRRHQPCQRHRRHRRWGQGLPRRPLPSTRWWTGPSAARRCRAWLPQKASPAATCRIGLCRSECWCGGGRGGGVRGGWVRRIWYCRGCGISLQRSGSVACLRPLLQEVGGVARVSPG